MRLQYKKKFLSINKSFEECEVPDFTIISGRNGVGKTHLLKAINNGSIEVKDIPPNLIMYYDVQSFLDLSENLEHENGIYQSIQSLKPFYDDKHIGRFVTSTSYNIYGKFGENLNYLKKIVGDEEKLREYFTNPDQNVLDVLEHYELNSPSILTASDIDRIFSEFKSELNKAHKKAKEKNEELYEFVRNQTRAKNLFAIGKDQVENPRLLLKEVEYAYLNYNQQRDKYKINLEDGQMYKEEDFIKMNGECPIQNINRILEEYDCNGYYFEYQDNWKPKQIALYQRSSGYKIEAEHLSSGEKILIGLALAIYKMRKPSLMPRLLLLDEIDSTLHPRMIQRLLNVLNEEFVNTRKMKVILVTHSPTTIALTDDSSLYEQKKEGMNIALEKSNKQDLISTLTDGFISLEAGLSIMDEIARGSLTVFTEGNNINYLKKAVELLDPELVPKLTWVENIRGHSGSKQLKVLNEFLKRMKHTQKVVFVYDCDVPFTIEEKNNTFFFKLGNNKKNDRVFRGIENLFPKELLIEDFFNEQGKLNKSNFEEFILQRSDRSDFELFKPIIEKFQKLTE